MSTKKSEEKKEEDGDDLKCLNVEGVKGRGEEFDVGLRDSG